MSELDDYQVALAQGYQPIREVARSTGVNAVTLRAWERRYGLVVPYRTPKGHRLYSSEHVARIQAILTWLARGVAVSQIKDLLEHHTPNAAPANNPWDELRQDLLQSIARQAERQLDEHFNRALALYPPRTLCQQLLLPLFAELEQRWHGSPFGARLEQVFFHTWLRSKLGTRLYHSNRQQNGAPLLLANLSDLPMQANLWLCAWLASSAGCPVELLDWPVPFAELTLAVEHCNPRALLLYASQALDAQQLRRELPRLNSACAAPLLLVGPATLIHAEELQALPGLHLAQDPLEAEQTLQQQGLLGEP